MRKKSLEFKNLKQDGKSTGKGGQAVIGWSINLNIFLKLMAVNTSSG
jgi:hypothetical protein